MKSTTDRMSTVLLALSLAPLAGCDEETGSALAGLQPVEGLAIRAYDGEGVEGSFTVDGATVELSVEKDGAARSASITDAEGAPLLESSAEAGREVVTLLGGRAVLSGDPNGDPHVEGDQGAHEELVARPGARRGRAAALEPGPVLDEGRSARPSRPSRTPRDRA